MKCPDRRVVALTLAIASSLATVTPAFAQAQGRVLHDDTMIWRANQSVVATTVDAGVILEIRAQAGRWYEIVIPRSVGGRGERGLIAVSEVALVPGSPAPPVRAVGANPAGPPPRQQAPAPRPTPGQTPRPAPRPTRSATAEPHIGVRAFGQAGLTFFSAKKSFTAVLGDTRGALFGGGIQLRFRNGFYAQGSLERFTKTGHRVFVFGDSVFPLDVADTITLTPLTVTGGIRFWSGRLATPYVGGGITRYGFTESSPATDDSEEVAVHATGYQAHAGIEIRTASWIATAAEVQYTSVGDGLGVGGVSQIYDEHNLGGVQIQFKILVGR